MTALLRAGAISSRELVEAHLDVAERQNRALHAWLVIDRTGALEQADKADKRLAEARAAVQKPPAPFIRCAASRSGSRTSSRSRAARRRPDPRSSRLRGPFDSTVTARVREAGAVILGKTNMDEFAMGSSCEHSAYGPTANRGISRASRGQFRGLRCGRGSLPRADQHRTDTGGSIRQPASLCGIVGMKPTYGRVSRYGIVAFASSLDQIGPSPRRPRRRDAPACHLRPRRTRRHLRAGPGTR